jgi:outer membrane lipoprotein SlyB
MRQILFVPAILLCASLLGCVSEQKNAIEGTWRVVYGTMKTADTTVSYSQANLFGMKMIFDNHWAIFGQGLHGGDTLAYYSGGTYTLQGNKYTESIKYNTVKSRIGRVIPFEVEVRNDTLIQKGPPKTAEYAGRKWELYEVWVRMK